MKLSDWVFAFVHGFRFEAKKLRPEETECFEPHVKEQMLANPCQTEVIQLNKPYRVALIFFLDETKPDLLIHAHQEKGDNLEKIVVTLLRKYSELQIQSEDLHKLLRRCRGYSESMYAIDFITNVCCICFTYDPRIKHTPFPWKLGYVNDPQQMAQMIFNLNWCQAVDEATSGEILEAAWKALEKLGYKKED